MLAGLYLRSFKLLSVPGGMLDDEAMVFDYSEKNFQSGKFKLYSPEYPHIEMLHGTIDHLLPKLSENRTTNQRAYAYIFGLLFFIFFFLIILSHSGSVLLACLTTTLLLYNFWHFYYSRIFCTVTVVLLPWLLSSYLFINLKKANYFIWLLGLVNVIAFFYYTSFRIIIIAQVITIFGFRHALGLSYKTIFIGLGCCLLAVLSAFFATDTNFSHLVTRGFSNYSPVTPQVLLNIGFSFLLPFKKPPIDYSYYSDHFMGDPISYAFYDVTTSLILGWAGTFFYLWGLLVLIKKIPHLVRSQPVVFYYILTVFCLTAAIIGIAGPSFSRLLPLTLIIAIISGYGIYCLLHYQGTYSTWLRAAVAIPLLLLPAETQRGIQRIEKSPINHLMFHHHAYAMLEYLKKERAGETFFIFCMDMPDLCAYYQKYLPHAQIFYLPSQLLEHLGSNKKPSVFWALYPQYPPHFFAKQFVFPLNLVLPDPRFAVKYHPHQTNKQFMEIRLR